MQTINNEPKAPLTLYDTKKIGGGKSNCTTLKLDNHIYGYTTIPKACIQPIYVQQICYTIYEPILGYLRYKQWHQNERTTTSQTSQKSRYVQVDCIFGIINKRPAQLQKEMQTNVINEQKIESYNRRTIDGIPWKHKTYFRPKTSANKPNNIVPTKPPMHNTEAIQDISSLDNAPLLNGVNSSDCKSRKLDDGLG